VLIEPQFSIFCLKCFLHFSYQNCILFKTAYYPFFRALSTNKPKFKNNTGIQDFWGLEVCNGFGGFGGRWVQKSYPFLSIWSGLAATGHTFYSFSQNIAKPHKKFQKLSPTIFNVESDIVITGCAFKCWNALSAVVELRRPTGCELVVASYTVSGNYYKILCQNSLCLVPYLMSMTG